MYARPARSHAESDEILESRVYQEGAIDAVLDQRLLSLTVLGNTQAAADNCRFHNRLFYSRQSRAIQLVMGLYRICGNLTRDSRSAA